MTIGDYRKKYVKEMMEQSNLTKTEALECLNALSPKDIEEYAAVGNPSFDVETEISYWDD